MAKQIANDGADAQAPKKLRRGVSNETRGTSQLRFHEKDAANNGLFIGHLDSVTVDWDTDKETGLRRPRLTLHFASNHTNASEQRHVNQVLFAVESSVDTIPDGKYSWRVDSVLNWIKHVLNTFYLINREFTEEEENDLTLDFVDFDENGDYVQVDAQEVANAYGKMFDTVAAMLNGTYKDGDGKPCYKDANGKFIPLWLKLLRHTKDKNGSWRNVGQNGELAFSSFVGEGAIEIKRANTPPTVLRIDLVRESITPKETNKTPTVGGIAPMGGIMAGGPIGGEGFSLNAAYGEAGEEMPF